jgi:hypothetical protein
MVIEKQSTYGTVRVTLIRGDSLACLTLVMLLARETLHPIFQPCIRIIIPAYALHAREVQLPPADDAENCICIIGLPATSFLICDRVSGCTCNQEGLFVLRSANSK